VGTLLPVPAALVALAGGPLLWPVALIAAVLAVESVAFAVFCLRFGVRRVWVVVDLLVVAAALAVSAGPPLAPGPAVESPLYNFALTIAVVAGLTDWPWWAAALAPAPMGLGVIAPLLAAAHTAYPVSTAVFDAFGFSFAALIAWPIARLVRRSARDYDQHRELTVARAGALARERERTRQGQALRARLMGTLEEVVAAGAVTDPGLAGQLRQETEWLRRIVSVGLMDPPPELDTGLRELVAEKTATGLGVVLELPGALPPLSADVRRALLDATREALTNVSKHAGVARATVRVTAGTGGGPAGLGGGGGTDQVTIEIVDQGRGYEPAESPPGTGQAGSISRRLADVGGTAEMDATPGRGTRVVLRAPAGQP
jgi:hypothetical protein